MLLLLVIVWIGGPFWLRQRSTRQFSQYDVNCFLQLGIFALAYKFRVEFDFDVRSNSNVLDLPMPGHWVENARAWSTNKASIHQLRGKCPAYQTAPSALADQFSHACTLKVPRHRVSARPCEFVNQHYLGPKDSTLRLLFQLSVARRDHAEQLALEHFDDVRSKCATAIEALIDDCSLLAYLSEEISIEVGVAAESCVGHVNVGNPAPGHLVYFAPVVLDPG